MSDILLTPNPELLILQKGVNFYFFGPLSSWQYSEGYLPSWLFCLLL